MRIRGTHTGRQAGHTVAVILHAEHVVTVLVVLLVVPILVLLQIPGTGLEGSILMAGYLDGWLWGFLAHWRTVAELLFPHRTSRLIRLEFPGKIKDTLTGMDASPFGALFTGFGALQLEI